MVGNVSWWAHQGSNLGPPNYQFGVLPLNYAPFGEHCYTFYMYLSTNACMAIINSVFFSTLPKYTPHVPCRYDS